MFIIFVFSAIFLIWGITEQIHHQKRVNSIPIRIHINGTRGKSTTTRLIAAGLREAGFKVLAKTTGTLPQLIFEDGMETPLKRRGSPNIIEQLKIFKEAAKRKVNVLVLECMAISPELQWVSEHKMVKSTIGVITNVREDHLEDVGPGLNSMAESLKLTIPQKGVLVTAEKDYFSLFKEQVDKLKTKIIWADPDDVSDKIIDKFDYMNFKENVSIALRVNKLLGVKEGVALRGMLKARPDPGALKVYKLIKEGKIIFFINAFAANDRHSTLLIWENIKKIFDLNNLPVIGIINSREDRVLRSIEFSRILATDIMLSKIILVGALSKLTERALLKLKVSTDKIINLGRLTDAEEVIEVAIQLTNNKVLLVGFGNTKGIGQNLIEYFNKFGEIK
ncbi:MAG TPA: poly-gamma-glutamate synthase PgsB [Candidatus Atribacteria bacterium]|jgi:poly-gamma-glutamate synthase PgsB/CapB|nr:poly-gamma-glutamate synthase PgsB [Candidatus Atribacteria bacterium]